MNNYISTAIILIVTLGSFKNTNVEGKWPRLIGGLPTKPREIKYLVGIYRNGDYICGGGIIGPRHIITAAHCVVDRITNELEKGELKIIAGSDNLKVNMPFSVKINVKKCYVPNVYDGRLWGKKHPMGDIAVLELNSKLYLTHNANLQKLELPPPDLELAPSDDDASERLPVEIAGFGRDNITYYTDDNGFKQMVWINSRRILLKGKVEIIDSSVCKNQYSEFKNYPMETIFCGRVRNYNDGTPQGLCDGDSGSPLVLNRTTVIGVASSGSPNCDESNYASTYAKVTSHYEFIKNAMQGITDDMRVQVL